MLKNVDFDCDAIHLPIIVFPVPGGPCSKIARGGRRRPVKMSGRKSGHTTASCIVVFANSRPAMSSQAEIYFPEINANRMGNLSEKL